MGADGPCLTWANAGPFEPVAGAWQQGDFAGGFGLGDFGGHIDDGKLPVDLLSVEAALAFLGHAFAGGRGDFLRAHAGECPEDQCRAEGQADVGGKGGELGRGEDAAFVFIQLLAGDALGGGDFFGVDFFPDAPVPECDEGTPDFVGRFLAEALATSRPPGD